MKHSSSFLMERESLIHLKIRKKNLLFVVLTQRTCLLSLEEWPNLEIFQHKTILVACKKFQYLIYNTKRYKAIAIQVFTKKKTKHGIIHLSLKNKLVENFLCNVYVSKVKSAKSRRQETYTEINYYNIFWPCFFSMFNSLVMS